MISSDDTPIAFASDAPPPVLSRRSHLAELATQAALLIAMASLALCNASTPRAPATPIEVLA